MASDPSILDEINILNTQLKHGQGVYDTIRLAYGLTLDEDCPDCIDPEALREQLSRFPEGQFVAVHNAVVVGIASTMLTAYPPTEPPRTWMHEIGNLGISKHDPAGEWLYGVDMAVRPDYRRKGIGTGLYKARFDLVKQLNLRGWYAGGMLMGYVRYADKMPPLEYGEKVIAGEIIDPTVTMQMNRGFEGRAVIENYMDEPDAGDTAVLIVWENPDYKESD